MGHGALEVNTTGVGKDAAKGQFGIALVPSNIEKLRSYVVDEEEVVFRGTFYNGPREEWIKVPVQVLSHDLEAGVVRLIMRDIPLDKYLILR